MKKTGYLLISYDPIWKWGGNGDSKSSYILIKYNFRDETSWMACYSDLSIIDATDQAIKDMYSRKINLYFSKNPYSKEKSMRVNELVMLNGKVEAELDDLDAAKLLYEITK